MRQVSHSQTSSETDRVERGASSGSGDVLHKILEKLEIFRRSIKDSGFDKEDVVNFTRPELIKKIEGLKEPFRALSLLVFNQFGYDIIGNITNAQLVCPQFSSPDEEPTSPNEQGLPKLNSDLNLIRNIARIIVESETQQNALMWRRSTDNVTRTTFLQLEDATWNIQIRILQELLGSFLDQSQE